MRQTLHMKGMYTLLTLHVRCWEECTGYENYKWNKHTGDGHYKWKKCTGSDITFERNEQGKYSCLKDGDHAAGHYIILFAEQLIRTFEVLVLPLSTSYMVTIAKNLHLSVLLTISISSKDHSMRMLVIMQNLCQKSLTFYICCVPIITVSVHFVYQPLSNYQRFTLKSYCMIFL